MCLIRIFLLQKYFRKKFIKRQDIMGINQYRTFSVNEISLEQSDSSKWLGNSPFHNQIIF